VTAAGQQVRTLVLGALVAGVAGCGPSAETVPPADVLGRRPADRLLDDPELQRVTDLALAGDVSGLGGLLTEVRPDIRARAVFSLPTAVDRAGASPERGLAEALVELMDDPAPLVRSDVVFALGKLDWSGEDTVRGTDAQGMETASGATDAGSGTTGSLVVGALAGYLATENDPGARELAYRTLGDLVSREPAAVEALVGMKEQVLADELHLWLAALAKMGNGVFPVPREVRDTLTAELLSPDAEVRLAAATFFSAVPSIRSWGGRNLFLRHALDEYARDDPAAIHVLKGLAPLMDAMDAARLREWANSASDWRARAAAVRGLNPETISLFSLVDALDDPSAAVAGAAGSRLRHVRLGSETGESLNEWLESTEGRLGAKRALLINRASSRDSEPVVDWATKALQSGTQAERAVAAEALAYVADEKAAGLLARLRDALDRPRPACPASTSGPALSDSGGTVDWAGLARTLPSDGEHGLEFRTTRGTVTFELFAEEAPLSVQAIIELASAGRLDCRWLEPEVIGESVRLRPADWNGDGEVPFGGTDLSLADLPAEITRSRPGRGTLVLVPWPAETRDQLGVEVSPGLVMVRSEVVDLPTPVTVIGSAVEGLAVLDRLEYLDLIESVRLVRTTPRTGTYP